MKKTISSVLADLTVNTKEEQISAAAYEAGKKMILDTLACAAAGYDAPGVGIVLDQCLSWGGKAEASVLFHRHKLPFINSVLVNGIIIHAMDLDDTHINGALHITSSVLPCAFGAAEIMGSNGKDLLTAMIIGIEVAARLSIEHRNRSTGLGFLQSSILGVFGAAAAICRLYKMSIEETIHAFGICYAQTAGNRQALFDATLTKRIQTAFAAQSAVMAVSLAKRGFTGPYNAFDGEAGLFKLYGCTGEIPDAALFSGLREFWQIEDISIKKYPSCGAAHPLIDVSLEAALEDGFNSERIKHVDLYLTDEDFKLVGGTFRMGDNPQVSAQFNVAYNVALALCKKDIRNSYISESSIRSNTDVLNFLDKISVHNNRELSVPHNDSSRIHTLRIVFSDGTEIIKEKSINKVLAVNAMGISAVREKFKNTLMDSRLGDTNEAVEIIDLVNTLEIDNHINLLLSKVSK